MPRYRQTMSTTIDVIASTPEEATRLIQEQYADWDTNSWWMPSTTVIVPDDDEEFDPINETYL